MDTPAGRFFFVLGLAASASLPKSKEKKTGMGEEREKRKPQTMRGHAHSFMLFTLLSVNRLGGASPRRSLKEKDDGRGEGVKCAVATAFAFFWVIVARWKGGMGGKRRNGLAHRAFFGSLTAYCDVYHRRRKKKLVMFGSGRYYFSPLLRHSKKKKQKLEKKKRGNCLRTGATHSASPAAKSCKRGQRWRGGKKKF